MKQYTTPTMIDLNATMESVYAASGTTNTPPGDIPPEKLVDITLYWAHHDSGTLSTLKIDAQMPMCYGCTIKIRIVTPGINYDYIKACSRGSAQIINNELVIEVNEFLNGGFNCNLDLVFNPGPFKGIASGSFKVPMQYDEHLYTPVEGRPVMPKQDELITSDLYGYCYTH